MTMQKKSSMGTFFSCVAQPRTGWLRRSFQYALPIHDEKKLIFNDIFRLATGWMEAGGWRLASDRRDDGLLLAPSCPARPIDGGLIRPLRCSRQSNGRNRLRMSIVSMDGACRCRNLNLNHIILHLLLTTIFVQSSPRRLTMAAATAPSGRRWPREETNRY